MKIIIKEIDVENGVWSWEIKGKTNLPYKDGTGDLDSVKKLLRNAGFDKVAENLDDLSCLEHFVVE